LPLRSIFGRPPGNGKPARPATGVCREAGMAGFRRVRRPCESCRGRSRWAPADTHGRRPAPLRLALVLGARPCLPRGACQSLQRPNRLDSYGVGFRSFAEPLFDGCGVFRDAVISIVATPARQERARRSERTKVSLARVRASGKRLVRPVRLSNGHRHAEVARLRAAGLSGREVGRRLGISEGSVRRLTVASA
jgi:hypothetical protein